jgi:hypothetical protein
LPKPHLTRTLSEKPAPHDFLEAKLMPVKKGLDPLSKPQTQAAKPNKTLDTNVKKDTV